MSATVGKMLRLAHHQDEPGEVGMMDIHRTAAYFWALKP